MPGWQIKVSGQAGVSGLQTAPNRTMPGIEAPYDAEQRVMTREACRCAFRDSLGARSGCFRWARG
jgi:hypothetical protein